MLPRWAAVTGALEANTVPAEALPASMVVRVAAASTTAVVLMISIVAMMVSCCPRKSDNRPSMVRSVVALWLDRCAGRHKNDV
jgi:hypothetical protein